MLKWRDSVLRHVFLFALYGIAGAFLTLVVGFVLYLNDRPDLNVWHLADLDEEFTAQSDVSSFEEYLALEDRLFSQLQTEVYDKISNTERNQINRYNKGSLSDPEQQPTNWNRSYELTVSKPTAGVLMIHGMSDSPYSLKALAERLHGAGVYVVGIRVPGHGTAPSGLTTVSWQDMVAAVQLAVRHLAARVEDHPIHLVGYSNGGALAVNYTLASIEDHQLPQVDSLALISPEIGLTRVAGLAKWQARLGTWLGLEKLAWNSLLPEYDPFKYGSFAVNAGNVAYQLTQQIQKQLTALTKSGELSRIPPILAFSSIVDATVSAPALIKGLFDRIEPGGHELVLFDFNRIAEIDAFLKWNPSSMVSALNLRTDRSFTLGLVTNRGPESQEVMVSVLQPGGSDTVNSNLALSWPNNIYSLSHVALPFPDDDPLYGANYPAGEDDLHLGTLALRGERGVLQIPASEMLRLRSNPFYPFLEEKVLDFFDLAGSVDQAE
jgi:alpha-beta hydrolase superfamily lysophospholipase